MKSLRWSRWGLLSMCCAASAFAAEGESPKDLFSKLDANQDGQLTLEEVPEDARPHFERLMRKGDKDENKSLSQDEFVAAHTPDAAPEAGRGPDATGGRGEGRGNPGQMFERLDANKDGKVSKSEIPAQAPQQVKDMLNRVFEKAGKEELSREEVMQAVGQMAKDRGGNAQAGGRGPGEMLQMLKQLDKNADGKVTQDEFPAEGGERLKGLLERFGGGDSIDLKKAEEFAARMGREGEGRSEGGQRPEGDRPRPDGERRPEGAPRGEGRPEGDRPRGDGPMPEGGPRGRDGGERGPEGRGPMPPHGRSPLLDELDENKDGRLSKDEFAKAAEVFGALDQNQDGSLDPRELLGPPPFAREGGRDMGPEGRPRGEGDRPRPDGEGHRPEGDRPRPEGEGPRPEGDRPRGEGDRPRPDGDRPGAGAGGRFNPDEFWKQLDKDGDGGISKEEAPERMKANFDTIDANKDGKIDREEGRKAMERGREAGAGGPGRDRRPEGDRLEGERRRPDADQPKPDGDKPAADKPAE